MAATVTATTITSTTTTPKLHVSQRDYFHLAKVCAALAIIGICYSFYGFNKILYFSTKQVLGLDHGKMARDTYENMPLPLTLKIYIFDVLNKDDVQNGGKPHLKEIGPYVFHEYISKTNISDDEQDDTMQFELWRKYIFQPELSNGLTGNEEVTTLHPVINLIGLSVNAEYRQFMHVAVAAIREIFHSPGDAFWTGRAMDLLFNGMEIDCSTKSPLARLVCAEFYSSERKQFKPINDETFAFSLFGGYNNSADGVFKVKRGKGNPRNIGKITEVNGQTQLNIWNGTYCNRIEGTDGMIFPPYQTTKEPISIFIRQFCRTIELEFRRKSNYLGISTAVFTHRFDYVGDDEKMRCFCRNLNKCPKKGTIDIMPCVGAPVTISLPHFLYGDPSLLTPVASGLDPSEKKHEFLLNVDLLTGAPLTGAGRIQFNFDLEPVKEIEVMANLPKMAFPLFWLEEGADMPDEIIKIIKYGIYLFVKLNNLIQTCSIFLLIAAVGSLFTHFLLKFNNADEEFEDRPSYLKSEVDEKSNPNVLMVEEVSSTDTIAPRIRNSFSAKN